MLLSLAGHVRHVRGMRCDEMYSVSVLMCSVSKAGVKRSQSS